MSTSNRPPPQKKKKRKMTVKGTVVDTHTRVTWNPELHHDTSSPSSHYLKDAISSLDQSTRSFVTYPALANFYKHLECEVQIQHLLCMLFHSLPYFSFNPFCSLVQLLQLCSPPPYPFPFLMGEVRLCRTKLSGPWRICTCLRIAEVTRNI